MLVSGLAVARVSNDKFIADLGDLVRHNIKEASGIDLIMLAKGSHYMRGFQHTTDVYATVHAAAMSKFNLR